MMLSRVYRNVYIYIYKSEPISEYKLFFCAVLQDVGFFPPENHHNTKENNN